MPVPWETFFGFLLAASVLVMSPGPDSMLIIRHSLSSGAKVGLATVAGVQFGLLGHNLLAVAGISMIIASSPLLFQTVAILGAGYLGWLGLQALSTRSTLGVGSDNHTVGPWKGFRDAFITNLLNPKVIVMFLALLPNFVDAKSPNVTAQLFTLTAGLIVINTIWQTPLALLGKVAREWLERPKVQTAINRTTGLILLLFAVLMVYENIIARQPS